MSIIEIAKEYISHGWFVFPCRGKIPATPHGFKDAIKDENKVESFFNTHKNIAIVTGSVSGIFVVDIDVKDGKQGDKSLGELIMQHGDFPETLISKTWSGGQHIFFRYPKDKIIKCKIDVVKAIDIRGDGGYIIAAPSRIKGKSYKWQIPIDDIMIADAPEWLLNLCEDKYESNEVDLSSNTSKITKDRHRTLLLMAVKMRKMGFDYNSIYTNLIDINRKRCVPPKSEKEINNISKDVSKYEESNNINEPLTDVWNSSLFYEKSGDDIKYCDALGGWYVWDGKRWKHDESYEIMRLAKSTVKHIFQMSDVADKISKKKLFSHAVKSESVSKLKAMIELTKSEPGITIKSDMFDKDLYDLNCSNGTIDLISSDIHIHNKDNFITKLIDVDYNKKAECPTWHRFLETVFLGDSDLIDYIQKAVGYSLSGSMAEQCLFILYGIGQNGKSTFLKHLYKILGDYAMNTPASTLIEKYNESIPNDIARLKAARFVTSIESGKHKKFAEAQIKQLTGDDPISARFLHKEFFDFFAKFKIFFATNHKPKISGTDIGIWRRIKTIPFEKTFTADEIDKTIDKKIESEYEGILAWAVEGFMKWKSEGLGRVDKIDLATAEYKEDSDIIGSFIEEQCVLGQSLRVKSNAITKALQEWAHDGGMKYISRSELIEYLKSKGYEKKRGEQGYVYWYGIGLQSGEELSNDRPY